MGKTVLKLQITKSSSNKGFSTQQSCHSCNGPQPSKPNRTEPNQGTYSDLTATSAGMGSSWRFRYSTIWPFLQTVNRERNKGRRFTYSDLTATSAGMGSSWGAGSRLMILGVTLPPSRLRLMILGTTLSPSRLARSSSWSRRALGARSGQGRRSQYSPRSPHSQVDIPSGAHQRVSTSDRGLRQRGRYALSLVLGAISAYGLRQFSATANTTHETGVRTAGPTGARASPPHHEGQSGRRCK